LEDDVLAAAAAVGMAIEVNTAGLRRSEVGETYPSVGVLERACRLGIPVIFGSDAHEAADVGAGFAQAVTCARAAGYDSTLRLSDRALVRLP
jgi:histidinol-phosphatase (PHP family)